MDDMAEEQSTDEGGGGGSRRSFLKYAGAGGAAAMVAGCKERKGTQAAGFGNSTGGTGGGGGGNDTNSTAATPLEDLPLFGEAIKIGCLAPQPDSFPVGQSMWNSMQMAVEDINKNGIPGVPGRGILGAKLIPVKANTEASPGTGREEFKRLVQKEQCKATFGTFLTQVTLQCFAPMKATKTTHITTAAAGPKPAKVVSDRYSEFKWHFRVGPINSFDLAKAELEFLGLYAEQLGWDKIAVLIENIGPFDPFAKLLDKNIRDVVDEVPVFKRSSSGTTNWTPLFDEVEASGAKLNLVSQALTGTSSCKQWANQKRSFEMGGIHLPAQIYEFWEEVSGACRWLFTMNAVTPQTTNTPKTQKYMDRYFDRFDTYPVYSGPITYDGVFVYAKAMADYVRKNDLQRLPTNAEMVDALENVKFTHGTILPEFQFTPKTAEYAHDPQWSSMQETGVPVWQQWQIDKEIAEDYGVMHSFAPEQNKTSEYKYPDWIDYPSGHPANN